MGFGIFTCIHFADPFIQSNLLLLSHWPEAPCFWKSPWSGNFWLLDNMRSSRLWWPQQLKPHPDTAAVKRREGNTSQGSGGSKLLPIRFKPRLCHYFSICKYAIVKKKHSWCTSKQSYEELLTSCSLFHLCNFWGLYPEMHLATLVTSVWKVLPSHSLKISQGVSL